MIRSTPHSVLGSAKRVWPRSRDGGAPRRLAKFSELWQGALDLALPRICAACRAGVAAASTLCGNCDRRFGRIEFGVCELCQEEVPRSGINYCEGCAISDSPLTACVAAIRFEGEAADWIHRFKYPRKGLLGLDPAPRSVVGSMLSEAAARAPGRRPDLIVPVPLHARRLRARGFNPAALLARSLARDLRIPCDPTALRRTRDTPSQTGLNRRDRRRNVRHAFRARRSLHAPEHIWLVDDVVTTASTLAEAAIALRNAGASSITGLCAARSLIEIRQ